MWLDSVADCLSIALLPAVAGVALWKARTGPVPSSTWLLGAWDHSGALWLRGGQELHPCTAKITAYLVRPSCDKLSCAAERRSDMERRNRAAGQAPVREHAEQPQRFPELSVVFMRHPVDIGGGSLPSGTKGTIVTAYGDGLGYEVEVFEPFHAVVTLEASDLVA